MSNDKVTWVLETGVFNESGLALREGLRAAGMPLLDWEDQWWQDRSWPSLLHRPVVFRGCLENAARVRNELPWRPGSFCRTEAFVCSQWYPQAAQWLVHRSWHVTTAKKLVSNSTNETRAIGSPKEFFVRPDSPLKPFAGRVVSANGLTLASLDHGYYYDDETLPVVVAPVCQIGREWRYVIIDGEVVAGSGYDPSVRKAVAEAPTEDHWRFAQEIAAGLAPPEQVYVLDICEGHGALRLLELNPFSGADLYGCDVAKVIDRVSKLAMSL